MTDRLIALVGDEQDVALATKRLAADLGYTAISFADPVKELATLVNPWVVAGQQPQNVDLDSNRLVTHVKRDGWDVTLAKLPELRRLLEAVEAAARWVFGESCWTAPALSQRGRVVLTDLRTQEQARAVRDRSGKIVHLVGNYAPDEVDRPSALGATQEPADELVRLGEVTTLDEADSPARGATSGQANTFDCDVSISIECGDGTLDVSGVVDWARGLEPRPFAPPVHAWAAPPAPPVYTGS